MTEHTPTPWHYNDIWPDAGNINGKIIFKTSTFCITEEDKANAKHIVRCVNNFDALLETLKKTQTAIYNAMHAGNLSRPYHDYIIDKIEQAIAKAEEA